MSEVIRLTEEQAQIYNYLMDPIEPNTDEWRTRNAVLCASRGFGKSFEAAVIGLASAQELMLLDESVPNKQVVIMAATSNAVSSIYVPLMNDMFQLGARSVKYNMVTNTWWLPNNVTLKLFSFEAVERLRGQGIHTLVTDEMTSWATDAGKVKDAWESVLYPCVTTRWSPKRALDLGALSPGRTLNISSPKGYDYFYDLYQKSITDEDWRSWHFDYTQAAFLDQTEIEKVKRTMDPQKFAREYLALFSESGNAVYYCFDRKKHVSKEIDPLREGEQLLIGLDFNVGKNILPTLNLVNSEKPLTEKLRATLSQARKGRCNDYPKGVHSSEWKREAA